MKNEYPTYLVLDIPQPMAGEIKKLRMKYDQMRAQLPIEITVFGSTGTREINPGQEIDMLIENIDSFIYKIRKFSFSFNKIKQFPKYKNSFYIEPDNKPEFINIHNIIKNNITFEYEKDNSEYMPHCTISTNNVDDDQIRKIKNEKISNEFILLNKLSLVEFSANPLIINYIHTWELK